MVDLNLGRIGFVDKGLYEDSRNYFVRDVVTYRYSTYRCIKDIFAGIMPPPHDPDHWMLMASGAERSLIKTGYFEHKLRYTSQQHENLWHFKNIDTGFEKHRTSMHSNLLISVCVPGYHWEGNDVVNEYIFFSTNNNITDMSFEDLSHGHGRRLWYTPLIPENSGHLFCTDLFTGLSSGKVYMSMLNNAKGIGNGAMRVINPNSHDDPRFFNHDDTDRSWFTVVNILEVRSS